MKESRAETAAFVSERPGCEHSVCVSAPCRREERGESTAAIISGENEYWYRFKKFSIKLKQIDLFHTAVGKAKGRVFSSQLWETLSDINDSA